MRRGLLLLLLAPPAWAQPVSPGPEARPAIPDVSAGTSLTAGTRGYRKIGLFMDAIWTLRSLDPYAWVESGADRDQRSLGLGGGVWKRLGEDWSLKGGLGLARGRYYDPARDFSSMTLETAAEKELGRFTAGGELRYTRGRIEGYTVAVPARRAERPRFLGLGRPGDRAAPGGSSLTAAEPAAYDQAEVSAYGRLRAFGATWGLRLGLSLPSYAKGIASQTLSVSVPAARSWRLRAALSAEQGREWDAYLSLGITHLFGS